MKKISKRLKLLKVLITKKIYSLNEAIYLIKTLGTAKFIESIEAHIHLNINSKYINQQLRTNIILPHNIEKLLKIAVLTDNKLDLEILKIDPTIIISETLIKDITDGKINFDILITTPELMPQLAKLGKILGPKGLMPSSKVGTITQNIKETIIEFKKGKFEYRTDKTGIVHLTFGKINFSENFLKENLIAIYNSIEKNKPLGIKGKYFKSLYICSTMSPSIQIDLLSLKNL